MTRQEIEEKVKAFLIDDLEIDEEKISDNAKLKEDMGIDSLDFVDIVVIVEKNFGFKIKPEEMQGVTTLSQFCDYIESIYLYLYLCYSSLSTPSRLQTYLPLLSRTVGIWTSESVSENLSEPLLVQSGRYRPVCHVCRKAF